MDTEGTSTHASACQEADRCEFEIENLRSRLAAKSPKTLDDIAGMASLWGAIAADMGASLLVVFKGLRLLRPNRPNNRS